MNQNDIITHKQNTQVYFKKHLLKKHLHVYIVCTFSM